ncbi:MAG: glycosyltransferase [Flavobacteriales bacterium]
MNICFLNSINFWGGGEKLHLENAIEFRHLGHKVIIAAREDSPLHTKSKLHGFKTVNVKIGNLSFLNPLKHIQLIKFFKKNNIDTVIFSASQDLKLGSLSANFAGVKRIVYMRGLATPVKGTPLNKIIYKNVLTHIIANSKATKNGILKNLTNYIESHKIKVIYHGIDLKHKVNITNKNLLRSTERGLYSA